MMLKSTPPPYDWTFRRVMGATLVLLSVVLAFWLLYRFNQVVFILFIALVMGTVIRPAVAWLHQHGIPRNAGVILIYLLMMILFAGFMVLLSPLIIEQSTTIVAAVPGYYQSLRAGIISYPNSFIVRLSEFLPAVMPDLKPVQQTGQDMMVSAGQVLGYISLVA